MKTIKKKEALSSKELVKEPNLLLKKIMGPIILPEPLLVSENGKMYYLNEIEPLNWLLYKKYLKQLDGARPSIFELALKKFIGKNIKPTFKESLVTKPISLNDLETEKVLKKYKKPCIIIANHSHTEDVAVALVSVNKPSYFLSGSLGQMLTNPDIVISNLVGFYGVERSVAESRSHSLDFSEYLLKKRVSLIQFSEGNYNDSSNQYINSIFNAAYLLGKRTGIKTRVEVSYWDSKDNKSYTKSGKVFLDAKAMSQEEFIYALRSELSSVYHEIIVAKGFTNPRFVSEKYKDYIQLGKQRDFSRGKDDYFKERTSMGARQHGIRFRNFYIDDYILKRYPDQTTGIDVLKDLSAVNINKSNIYLYKDMMAEQELINEYDKYNVSSAMFRKLFDEDFDAFLYNKLAHQYKKNSEIIKKNIFDFYKDNEDMTNLLSYLDQTSGLDFVRYIYSINILDPSLDKLFDFYPIDVPEWVIDELKESTRVRENLMNFARNRKFKQ